MKKIKKNNSKVVLITGTSSGIGRATASYLSELGFKVYGTVRDTKDSYNFDTIKMDVTDDSSVKNGIKEIIDKEGRIDVLINNAGIGIAGAIEDTSIDEIHRQFDTNFFGLIRVCQNVLPIMREQGCGLIINIASMAGQIGLPYQGIYSASKFAIEGLSEALRLEVKQFGIDVVLIEPGDIATSFTKNRALIKRHKNKTSYSEGFAKTLEVIEKDESSGLPPEKIAKKIFKIITSRHRRFRYTPGAVEQQIVFFLKKLLPYSVFSLILTSHYKIPTRKK